MRTRTDYDRFAIVKHGYDPEAVESHLNKLEADADAILDEAAGRIADLENSLEEAKRHEEAIHLTILAATKTKEDMLEAAQLQAEQLRIAGRKDGDRVVTEARMQAFQLVTEARSEAETIVAEARAEAAAVARAEVAASHIDATPSDREIALQNRIDEMQSVIAAMESEIRSRYATTSGPNSTHDIVSPVVATDASESPDLSSPPADDVPVANDERESHIEIIVTDAPGETPVVDRHGDEALPVSTADVPLEADASAAPDDARASAVRSSFYSRRSAKLPRIGVEAGRGAMAAAAGLRTNLNGDGPTDSTEPENTPEYEAV